MKQGALSTPLVKGFQIVSSQVPQAGAVDSVLGFQPEENDTVYRFDNASGAYTAATYEFGEWVAPVLRVGEAFFLDKQGNGTAWTRTFNVQ